jgi:hypothetical protein
MDEKLVSRWWKILLHVDHDILGDSSMPFVNMGECIEHFRLALPELPKPSPDRGGDKKLPEPGFDNLTQPILVTLRRVVFSNGDKTFTSAWAEKLLRYGEVRFSSLSSRARRKWGTRQTARLNFLQLAAFLLDYGAQQGDLRFLNITLKFIDQKWLFNIRSIKRCLRGNRETALAALFQIRILLMTETIIDKYKVGKNR